MKFELNEKNYYRFSEKGLEVISLVGAKKDRETAKYLGNFIPVVTEKFKVVNHEKASIYLGVKLLFTNGSKSEPFEISLDSLECIKWAEDIDERCILNPEVPKIYEHIATVIRLQSLQIEVAEKTAYVVDRFGGHKIEETFVFHTGNELIWPSDMNVEKRPRVIFRPETNKRLVVDNTYSEKQADIAMNKFISVCPEAGAIIFALNLVCLQWSAFEEAGIVPRCSVFLHGKSGVKKTTYATFATQIFNRDLPLGRPERFNSSIPAILEIMKDIRHRVQLIDDLYPTDNPTMCRNQEKTLLEVLRVVADGVEPARVKGGKVLKTPPRCGLLLTGEYYIGTGSDAARMIPIEIKTPINSVELSECQSEPLALSTFYRFYLQWFTDNYHEIVADLVEMRKKFLIHIDNEQYHSRLKEMQFCLESAYKIYLLYRADKEFISVEEMFKACKELNTHLSIAIVLQDLHIKKGKVIDSPTDYLSIIKSMIRNREFLIVGKPSDFKLDKHDAVMHKGYLYFRKEKLLNKIRRYDKNVIFEDVIQCIEQKRALKRGKDTIAVQLHKAGNGLRFYAIKWDVLSK